MATESQTATDAQTQTDSSDTVLYCRDCGTQVAHMFSRSHTDKGHWVDEYPRDSGEAQYILEN